MRDYGRVYSAFWQSPEMRAMPEDARTLALYLLTTPHGNLIGCFRLPEAYAADDLQWPFERVREGFRNLSANGFATVDEATKWLRVAKYLKWNAFENPNVAKAAHKAFDQVPDGALKSLLAKDLLEYGAHLSEPFAKGCRTVCEGFRKPEPEPEPFQSLSTTTTTTRTRKPSARGKSVSAGASLPAAPTASVWACYASAYEEKYGATPVRNAQVNGQLAQLVARLGADDAPQVAGWFLGHRNGLYVAAMHPTNLLLRDCEKLRTEWATGRQVTRAQAQLVDKTQTNLNAFAGLLAEAERKEREHGHT